MSRYGLEPSHDFWSARFDRRMTMQVGADPAAPPGSGKDVAGLGGASTDDVLQYARYVDSYVEQLDRAFHHWESDPPGCGQKRCILVLAQWNQDMGALGPWQLWREQWQAFEQRLATSYWARVGAYDDVISRHKQLLQFLAHARELGLPGVPDGGQLPNTYVEDAKKHLGGAADHVESILDKLLLGGALVAAVLIAKDAKAR